MYWCIILILITYTYEFGRNSVYTHIYIENIYVYIHIIYIYIHILIICKQAIIYWDIIRIIYSEISKSYLVLVCIAQYYYQKFFPLYLIIYCFQYFCFFLTNSRRSRSLNNSLTHNIIFMSNTFIYSTHHIVIGILNNIAQNNAQIILFFFFFFPSIVSCQLNNENVQIFFYFCNNWVVCAN